MSEVTGHPSVKKLNYFLSGHQQLNWRWERHPIIYNWRVSRGRMDLRRKWPCFGTLANIFLLSIRAGLFYSIIWFWSLKFEASSMVKTYFISIALIRDIFGKVFRDYCNTLSLWGLPYILNGKSNVSRVRTKIDVKISTYFDLRTLKRSKPIFAKKNTWNQSNYCDS